MWSVILPTDLGWGRVHLTDCFKKAYLHTSEFKLATLDKYLLSILWAHSLPANVSP